jgi:metal-dependent HD superfamily phosphatase/phosphodiesterase
MAESKGATYEAIAEYWDTHEMSDQNSEPVELEVDLQRPATYFPIEKRLADQLETAAAAQGVSSKALLNRWVQQKIEEEVATK